MSKTWLITGASDGIGLATARLAAQEGAAVLMVSRDRTKLTAAAATVTGAIVPETAAVDLTDPVALEAFIVSLDERGYVPDVLVNNAGQGSSGVYDEADWPRLDAMLRLNVNGLARLTH